jgi:hypothetical protein
MMHPEKTTKVEMRVCSEMLWNLRKRPEELGGEKPNLKVGGGEQKCYAMKMNWPEGVFPEVFGG